MQGNDEHILIIDDDSETAFMMGTLLKKIGYKTTIKTNSQDLLDVFKNSPNDFDLVLCDQSMPSITGLALSEKLLEIRSDIPIVLMSGYFSEEQVKNAKNLGIKNLLKKPIILTDLALALSQAFLNKKE